MSGRRAVVWIVLGAALLIPPAHAAPGKTKAPGKSDRPHPPRRNAMAEPDLQPRTDKRIEVGGFVPSALECTVRATLAGLAQGLGLDCDDQMANNESQIVVDPTDPLHAVVSSNDYGSCCDEFYTTFDGGLTWKTGNMSGLATDRNGSDPVTSFDPRHHVVLHASLSFRAQQGQVADGHVVVSVSRDGGVTWDKPVVVAEGKGAGSDPVAVFNDKEWMATDTTPASPHYGRTYLTWTRFVTRAGADVESAIWAATSDDGGRTWSEPQEISGRDPELCSVFSVRPGRCDQDQDSIPAIAADGTVFVAFQNFQHAQAWESPDDGDTQYLVVRSTDGGRTFSAPVHAADLEDGRLDYPRNADGRETLTGTEVRVSSAGNLAVDPRTGALSLVFSDNRAGRRGVNPVTDTNVYVVTSPDGRTWSGPFPVATGPGEQWFPWAAVDPVNGDLVVAYNDSDPETPGRYGVSLARGRPGAFRTTALAPKRSDLRQSLFFQAQVPGCQRCAYFNGDYIGVDVGRDGRLWAAWTDMRDQITLNRDTGRREQIYVTRR